MNAEDIAASLVLGFLAGLLIFAAIAMSHRGKPWWVGPPVRPPAAPTDDPRYRSPTPEAATRRSNSGPFDALFTFDRVYVLVTRLVLLAMVLYGAWLAPRLRWVLLAAVSTLALLHVLWHYVARWLGARGDT